MQGHERGTGQERMRADDVPQAYSRPTLGLLAGGRARVERKSRATGLRKVRRGLARELASGWSLVGRARRQNRADGGLVMQSEGAVVDGGKARNEAS